MENRGINNYIKDSYNELVHKVTWPTWPNLLSNSVAVVVATLIFALIVFIMDAISKGLLDLVYSV